MLSAAAKVVGEPEVFEDFGVNDRRLVAVRGTVGKQPIEITHVLRVNSADLVREIRVFVRPLAGLAALLAGLGPRLARRRSRTRAALAHISTRPLAAIAPLYERMAERLITR